MEDIGTSFAFILVASDVMLYQGVLWYLQYVFAHIHGTAMTTHHSRIPLANCLS
jgi:hypothetical protein